MKAQILTRRKSTANVNTTRIRSLDGIKGICAFIIAFIWHYQHFQPAGSPFYRLFKPFYDHGDLAVEVFFLLSGFLLALRHEEDIAEGRLSFRAFLASRIKSIFPMFIAGTLVTAVLQLLYLRFSGTGTIFQYDIHYFNLLYFVLNLLGLQTGLFGIVFSFNGPAWYISVLLLCSVLYYLTVYVFRRFPRGTVAAEVLWVAAGIVMFLAGGTGPFFNILVGRGLICLFEGALIARHYKSTAGSGQAAVVVGWAALGVACLTVLLAVLYGYGVLLDMNLYVGICLGPCLLMADLYLPVVDWFFSLPPFLGLGKLSFAVYIWHFPVQIVLALLGHLLPGGIDFSRKMIWILYVICVLALSELIYLIKQVLK